MHAPQYEVSQVPFLKPQLPLIYVPAANSRFMGIISKLPSGRGSIFCHVMVSANFAHTQKPLEIRNKQNTNHQKKTPSITYIAWGWICNMVFYPRDSRHSNKISKKIVVVLDSIITRDTIYFK